MKLLAMLVSLAMLYLTTAFTEETYETWTPEAVLSIKNIETILVSPDNRHTLLIVKRADLEKKRWVSELFVVNHSNKIMNQLAGDTTDISQPSWSVQSDRIWFIANGENHRALWEVTLSSSASEKRYEAKMNIESYAVAEDEKTLAFTTNLMSKQKYASANSYGVQIPKGLWIKQLDSTLPPVLVTNEQMIVGARD